MPERSARIVHLQPSTPPEPVWPALISLRLSVTAPSESAALGLAASILTEAEPWQDGYVVCRGRTVQITGELDTVIAPTVVLRLLQLLQQPIGEGEVA